MEIFNLQNVSFKYSGASKNAINNISLSVNKGDFLVLCGESGCGKSTLIKLLKKEVTPYGKLSGEITFENKNIKDINQNITVSEIGFIMQNPETQIVTDTVWHELAFGLENLGFDNKIIRRRVAEMAGYFGISDWLHKKTAELSGGGKQLLNLASIMALNPKVLLLDEPTAQLDPIAASNFINTIYKLNRETGITVILIEHRLEEVFPIADKVLLLDKGEVSFYDSPKNINEFFKNNPLHKLKPALPAATRIFNELSTENQTPLTVREGRSFLVNNFENKIDTISKTQENQNTKTVLELKEIYFKYQKDSKDILKGASLNVKEGENYFILGGNGSGKSTLLMLIAGINKPVFGSIKLFGEKVKNKVANNLLKNIGYLPQNPQDLFLENTLYEDFCEVLDNYKSSEQQEIINTYAKKFGIENLLNMHPYDLSGGEQQKAALIKVLLKKPKILLLDEPTKGIDAFAKLELSKILKELNKNGVTIITVSHDVEFAAICATRCGMFFDGEIVSSSDPSTFFLENNFYTTSANRISRGFYKNAVLVEDVVNLCKQNGRRVHE